MVNSFQVVRHGRNEMNQYEEQADGTTIQVGMLVERTVNGVVPHATDGGNASNVLVAKDARQRGMELGDSYAAGELTQFLHASGGGLHMLLAAGETVDRTSSLVSAGDGTLRAIDQDGTAPDDPDAATIGQPVEAVDNSGGTEAVYVAVDIK